MSRPALRLVRRPAGPARLDGLPALLARVLAARGVAEPGEVEHVLQRLPDFRALLDIDVASARLARAVTGDEPILVVGDFDADGATSTALALRGLRALGARRVDYLVPNRFEFGYGLTPEIVEVAAQRRPALIVTVDNGIASLAGVARARALGIDVIVTDHHLPGEALPEAVAIVNPNRPGDPFPGKALAGVGVLFYVLIALRQRLREDGWFDGAARREPNLAQWLDLVALGTVADVVPLDHGNRILVEQGLRRIRAGRACPGILALLRAARREPARAVASDLGFAVGPRLNAAGRLEDMSLGIECLLTDDPGEARRLAAELDALNQARREIEGDMQAQAEAAVRRLQLDGEPRWGLTLYRDDWHQGVVGLVASRLRERTHRPVVAFARADDKTLKGSGRSIPGLHLRDALAWVDSHHPGLIERFGGHAMAAGLSLPGDHLGDFEQAFDAAVRALLDPEALQPVLYSDGELRPDDFRLDTARALRDLAPWGQGFPEPLFDGWFRLLDQRVLQERHLRLQLAPRDAPDRRLAAICFNADLTAWPAPGALVQLAYHLDVNWWRDSESLQLRVAHLLAVRAG